MLQARPIKALVIGARDNGEKRNIGGELCKKLVAAPNWHLGAVVTSKQFKVFDSEGQAFIQSYGGNLQEFDQLLAAVNPDVGFICIPTRDDGTIALGYLNSLLKSRPIAKSSLNSRTIASTAEKGITSHQPEQIIPRLECVDVSAVVGGGNQFLYQPKLQHLRSQHAEGRRITIVAVINATCNFATSFVQNSSGTQEEAVGEALKLGIAEPLPSGERPTFRGLINGEISDKIKKACSFYNILMATGSYLHPRDFGNIYLNEEYVALILRRRSPRRLVLKITNHVQELDWWDRAALCQVHKDGWHLSIGFRPLQEDATGVWLKTVDGINNGILLKIDDEQPYSFIGPGAGPETATAMIEGALRKWNDMQRLRRGILQATGIAA